MDIRVFALAQNHLTDSPAHLTTRRWMRLALASGKAQCVGQHAFQLRNGWTWREFKAYLRAGQAPAFRASGYIPLKMPPLNVPGVWFQEPQSDTWKLQHRTAWQSYPANLSA